MAVLDPTSQRVFRVSAKDIDLARDAIGTVHQRAPVDERALATFLASGACYLFVSVVAGEVVGSLNGHCLLTPARFQPQFLLYEIDVKPAWRRRGVGTGLVDAFLAEARASGASEVWVVTNDSNQAAMALYRHCGLARRHPDDVMLSIAL